jgi:hypothetical protein
MAMSWLSVERAKREQVLAEIGGIEMGVLFLLHLFILVKEHLAYFVA